jgi:hypothetical protein
MRVKKGMAGERRDLDVIDAHARRLHKVVKGEGEDANNVCVSESEAVCMVYGMD